MAKKTRHPYWYPRTYPWEAHDITQLYDLQEGRYDTFAQRYGLYLFATAGEGVPVSLLTTNGEELSGYIEKVVKKQMHET